MQSRGLGDTIEKVTKATGVKKVVETISKRQVLKQRRKKKLCERELNVIDLIEKVKSLVKEIKWIVPTEEVDWF